MKTFYTVLSKTGSNGERDIYRRMENGCQYVSPRAAVARLNSCAELASRNAEIIRTLVEEVDELKRQLKEVS